MDATCISEFQSVCSRFDDYNPGHPTPLSYEDRQHTIPGFGARVSGTSQKSFRPAQQVRADFHLAVLAPTCASRIPAILNSTNDLRACKAILRAILTSSPIASAYAVGVIAVTVAGNVRGYGVYVRRE
ncbi:unnamed protein product [Peniophora sp. CBMAI 1063]|nr:unnamed protein product [Peniophora sp. CBMAI 1063]